MKLKSKTRERKPIKTDSDLRLIPKDAGSEHAVMLNDVLGKQAMDSKQILFEKLGYDYAREARDREYIAKARQHDKPIKWRYPVGIGAVGGGAVGALTGKGAKGRLLRGAAGAAIGGGIGGIIGLADRLGIADAKEVMKMSPSRRKEFLAARSRDQERFLDQLKEERRHQELMYGLRNK